MKILVDTAVELPVNIMPLLDDGDFKTRETSVAYNAGGMDLVWNFVTPAGVITQTAVTPTTGGTYDWAHVGDGMYKIEMPASGGASINNDTEGYGYFSGIASGVLPWRSPTFEFVPANIANSLVLGTDKLEVDVTQVSGDSTAADTLELFAEALDQSTGQIDEGTFATDAIAAAAVKADAASKIAAATEAAILDEGDATALLAAISAKIEEFLINEGDATATLAAIAAAVRTNLATELGRIDAAVSTRASQTSVDDVPTVAEFEARTLVAASYATASALTALAGKFSGITLLANWLRAMVRKDTADATAKTEINNGGGGYNEATDSQEGLRDSLPADGYYADIDLSIDEANTQDEYTVRWFKNVEPITSGITSPTITVTDRGGNVLINAQAMTQIGSTGAYKYDATTTARITAGEGCVVSVAATIDAGTRTYDRVLSRDSTA